MKPMVLPPCLHCAAVELTQHFMAHQGLSVNEAAYKLTEALATLLAGVGDETAREQFMADIGQKLPIMLASKVADRQTQGLAPYRTLTVQ